MIHSKEIQITWNASNKKRFVEKGYVFSDFGNVITVKVSDLPKTSHYPVEVKCDYCGKIIIREYHSANKSLSHTCSKECKRMIGKTKVKCHICDKDIFLNDTQMKNSKSGFHFCSNECVGIYNSKTKNKKIKMKCVICGKEMIVKQCHSETAVTCSRKCQGKWQSENLIGTKANNFRNAKTKKKCAYCGETYELFKRNDKLSKFCSQKCKQKHWAENVITRDSFKLSRFEGNIKYRQTKKETKPERLVREWLDKNHIRYIQEKGFFHKYYADFWIIGTKITIEVYGDYWHCNPKIYNQPMNDHQKEQIQKDNERINEFIKYGFSPIIIWERDIYDDVDRTMKEKISQYIPVTTTCRASNNNVG